MLTPRAALPLALAPLVFAIGCGSSEPAAGAAASSGGGGSAPAPVLDPSLFDCSRATDPARSPKVPASCATDPSCATRLVSGHRGTGGDLGVFAPDLAAGVTGDPSLYGQHYDAGIDIGQSDRPDLALRYLGR